MVAKAGNAVTSLKYAEKQKSQFSPLLAKGSNCEVTGTLTNWKGDSFHDVTCASNRHKVHFMDLTILVTILNQAEEINRFLTRKYSSET